MTDQMKLFAIEYVKTGNMTQAAINAGYSEASAYNQGSRLMKNDEVVRYVEELQGEIMQGLRVRMIAKASSAISTLEQIMNDENAKDADRAKCAVEILNRAGFGADSNINLKADVSDSILHLEVVKASDDEGTISC